MANSKEAKARIKINKLLEQAGWRFFDNEKGQANISLEPNVKLTQKDIDAFGEDFESTKNGFIDFLLLDEKGFPLVILEAKKEDKNPLDGKEQARKYAHTENARFVILSNGNLHYFWDLERHETEISIHDGHFVAEYCFCFDDHWRLRGCLHFESQSRIRILDIFHDAA